jgi:hypothetical protein
MYLKVIGFKHLHLNCENSVLQKCCLQIQLAPLHRGFGSVDFDAIEVEDADGVVTIGDICNAVGKEVTFIGECVCRTFVQRLARASLSGRNTFITQVISSSRSRESQESEVPQPPASSSPARLTGEIFHIRAHVRLLVIFYVYFRLSPYHS